MEDKTSATPKVTPTSALERRGGLPAVRQQVLNVLAVVGRADAQPASELPW